MPLQRPGACRNATLTRPIRTGPIFGGMNDDSDPVPMLKQQIARAILEHLESGGQVNLADRIGVDQPRASDLQRGRLQRFSLQQLVRFAARADGEVTINIRWTSRRVFIIPRRPAPYRFPPSSR